MNVRRVCKLAHLDIESKGPLSALITNGFGSYFAIDESLSYQGWYVLSPKDWRMQKIIESITPVSLECVELQTNLNNIRRKFSNTKSDNFFSYQKTLLYSTTGMNEDYVRLTLDNRDSYDSSKLGRKYDLAVNGDIATITFTQEGDFTSYLVIKGVKKVKLIDSWREKEYSFDKNRNAQSTYWVYDAIEFIPSSHCVFSVSQNLIEARTIADITYFHFDDIISNIQTKSNSNILINNKTKGKLSAAISCSANSLLSLIQNFSFDHRMMPGIYAGLPWFFQIWSRDELISLGGLIALAKEQHNHDLFSKIKKILGRHIKSVLPNGDLDNRFPYSELGSVDSLGWLARRVKDFLIALKEEKLLYTLFSPVELVGWSEDLKDALARSKKNRLVDGLFKNDFNETWMDTSYHDDGRVGFRIEIQALYYSLYESIIFIERLVNSPFVNNFINEQKQFLKTIRDNFIDKRFAGYLIDGKNFEGHVDRTYRPNVFLAAYLAPDILSKKEWLLVFDVYLKKLYLPWGGLSTIGFDSSLYQPTYTGQDNKSYHRGDSWYFINNIAAIVLDSFGRTNYETQIRSIEHASAKDCIDLGFLGHCSEVSSSSFQEAQGSLSQAWSASTFLELTLHRYSEND